MTKAHTLNPLLQGTVLDGVENIYQYLRNSILRGRMPAGVPVSQVQLAQQLGVSRTPLREALRMLQNEGLIVGEMNRRVQVPPLSLPDLDDLYALRISVETLAVRLSVPQLTDSDLNTLHGYIEHLQILLAGNDLAAYEEGEAVHSAFHLGLVQHAGERLKRQVQHLHDHTDRYRYAYTTERLSTPRHVGQEHQALYEAAAARDGAGVATRLARHYASTVIGLIGLLEPTFEPKATRTALKHAISL